MTDPSVQRVSTRFRRKILAARAKGFQPTLAKTQRVVAQLKDWVRQFPSTLRQAKAEGEGAPRGWVWQAPFIVYFKRLDIFRDQLRDLDYTMEGLASGPDLSAPLADKARKVTKGPPRKGRVSYAIGKIDFAFDPTVGEEGLIYQEARLQEWAGAFTSWATKSEALLDRLEREAR